MDTNEKIRILHVEGRTGSLLLVVDNTTACLYFQRGQIAGVAYRNKSGTDALGALHTAINASARPLQAHFTDAANNPIPAPDVDLPDTETIIGDLAKHGATSSAGNAGSAIGSSKPKSNPSAQSSGQRTSEFGSEQAITAVGSGDFYDAAQCTLDAAAMSKLEAITIDVVGPIGQMLCQSAISADQTLQDAVRRIANEISEPKAAAQFRRRVEELFHLRAKAL